MYFNRFCSAFACVLICAACFAQPWSQYGGNPQHTALSPAPVQSMKAILWHTPVDLYPPYAGTDLFIHYGSPLITANNNVIVTVRTGPNALWPSTNDTFRVECHSVADGSTLWTEATDYIDPPHDWIPSCGSALTPSGALVTPAAGGTVLIRSGVDAALRRGRSIDAVTPQRVAFYGTSEYLAHETSYNANVFICTPITVDSLGNSYFGFFVTSGWSNTYHLSSGVARISSGGVGTWVSASTASGNANDEVQTNAAPALSPDGKYLYVAVKGQGVGTYSNPKLLRLNASTLQTASKVALVGPSNTFAYMMDDGTATPMVGSDGDVYFGVWYSVLASRGFMLHYSADLSTSKPAGAFGWDDTSSMVPAAAVPSYHGTSPYLILTKYNNYADPGCDGDGLNKVAILDPNNTENYTVQFGPTHNPPDSIGPTYVSMKEVLTVLGPTLNPDLPGRREWCINSAAIDPFTKSAIVNSEDGHCYRWNFVTNTLTDNLNLATPTGEAYTPTITGPDGLAYAINNASLFALWDGAKPTSVAPTVSTIHSNVIVTMTLKLSAPATGPGATVKLTSTNSTFSIPASVFVPAGASSVTFSLIAKTPFQSGYITATRYKYSAKSNLITVQGLAWQP